ncbi:MAG: hypothetical protein RL322_1858 [Pseudomonadota bacterium]|jgi:probable rRNA maturation factor
MSVTPRRRAERPTFALDLQCGSGVRACPVPRARLRRWIASVLNQPALLTVRLVNRAEARALNAAYRDRDYAPDVLTFEYGCDDQGRRLADIVICLPVLREQARAAAIPLDHRFAHLLIHGVLHAQGLDHQTAEEAQQMESIEIAALRRFRIPDPYKG